MDERLRAYHQQRLEDLGRENARAAHASRWLNWILSAGFVLFAIVAFYVMSGATTENRLTTVLLFYGLVLAVLGAMDLVERATLRRTDAEIRALKALLDDPEHS